MLKYFERVGHYLSIAYMPLGIICGVDPNPQPVAPEKVIKMPPASPGVRAINTPRPKYPLEARQKHWEGTMLLEFLVRTDGTVSDVKVLQSTGHKILDEDAVQALRRWHFRPGTADHVQMPLTFTLHCSL